VSFILTLGQSGVATVEGNWITRVYENNLKMMSSTRDAFLGTRNVVHGVAVTDVKMDVEHMSWLVSYNDP
jgi:hypothetical protein